MNKNNSFSILALFAVAIILLFFVIPFANWFFQKFFCVDCDRQPDPHLKCASELVQNNGCYNLTSETWNALGEVMRM